MRHLMLRAGLLTAATLLAPAAPAQTGEQRAVILNQLVLSSSVATLERRSDVALLARDARIRALQAELRRQGGRNVGLLRQIRVLQDEQIAAISRQSTERALAVQAFRKATETLVDSSSSQVQAALNRYAAGDAAALAELASLLATAGSGPARLEADRGFATLVTDAVARRKADAAGAIAAWRRVVARDPDDYDAWSELSELYRLLGDARSAATAAQQMERVSGAVQSRVQALVQRGRAAEAGEDLAGAARLYREAVAAGEGLVERQALDFPVGPTARPGSEGLRARAQATSWAYQFLRLPLTYLAMVEARMGEYPEAVASMQRATELDAGNVAIHRRYGSSKETLDAALLYLSGSAERLGQIASQAGRADVAQTAYSQALSAMKEQAPGTIPVSAQIGLARALSLSGAREDAAQALAKAETGLTRTSSGTYKFGLEGEYWEQRGELALAAGRRDEAAANFRSAREALRQAVPDDDASQRWAQALKRVDARR